jgi:hypothetical protein
MLAVPLAALGWAGLLLSTTTFCLQKHKQHTCRTAQQQEPVLLLFMECTSCFATAVVAPLTGKAVPAAHMLARNWGNVR